METPIFLSIVCSLFPMANFLTFICLGAFQVLSERPTADYDDVSISKCRFVSLVHFK